MFGQALNYSNWNLKMGKDTSFLANALGSMRKMLSNDRNQPYSAGCCNVHSPDPGVDR